MHKYLYSVHVDNIMKCMTAILTINNTCMFLHRSAAVNMLWQKLLKYFLFFLKYMLLVTQRLSESINWNCKKKYLSFNMFND